MLFYHQHQCNQCYLLSYPGIHIAIEFINLIYLFISLALLPKVTYQSAKSDTSLLYSPCFLTQRQKTASKNYQNPELHP